MKKRNSLRLVALILVCAMSFIFTAAAAPQAVEGENTVYVMTDPQGKAQKLIVTDSVAAALPSNEGKGLMVTDPDGNEISRGNQDGLMPVNIKISYSLDGKSISPQELKGRDGRVTIRFDYENLSRTTARIQGRDKEIYTPFLVITGMILDGEKFSDPQISSGKIISDGSRYIVCGVALPGLQENLNINKEELDIPSYVEISADCKDFALSMSMSLVTNNIFEGELDLSSDRAQVRSAAGALRTAIAQLQDGSAQLYSGLETLLTSCGLLSDGVSKLSDGLSTLDSNSAALTSGAAQVFEALISSANSQIEQSLGQNPGLSVSNYNEVLPALIASLGDENGELYKQTYAQVQAAVEAASAEIETAVKAAVLEGAKEKAAPAVEQAVRAKVSEAVRANEPAIRQQVTAKYRENISAAVSQSVKEQIFSGLLAAFNLSSDDYNALPEDDPVKQQLDAALASKLQSPETQAAISAAVDAELLKRQEEIDAAVESSIAGIIEEKMASEEIKAQIAALTESEAQKFMESAEGQALIAQNVEAVKAQKIAEAMAQVTAQGQGQLTELLNSLNNYAAFNAGLVSYTGGVSAASAGAKELKSQMPALTEGITKLRDGAAALNTGVIRFGNEGIGPIVNALDGDLSALSDRLSASVDAARSYRALELPEGETLSFIYRSAEIG